MTEFKHYILTRFNLGIYSFESPYLKVIETPEGWMRHRMQLFEQTALPSVMSQTCREFRWLIAFDPLTPEAVIRRYAKIEQVEVCHEQPHLHLRRQQPGAEWLITTRFDNDDILLPDFVATIQGEFRRQQEVIDVEYQKIENDNRTVRYPSMRPRPNSPFLTLVERWGVEPMTALGRPHTVIPDVYEARKLPEVLAYMVIHDRNVINKI